MNGIALGTRLGFAVCVLLMMPVLLPVACAESLRQRLAGAAGTVASDADGGHHRVDDVVVVVVECHWLLDCRR